MCERNSKGEKEREREWGLGEGGWIDLALLKSCSVFSWSDFCALPCSFRPERKQAAFTHSVRKGSPALLVFANVFTCVFVNESG